MKRWGLHRIRDSFSARLRVYVVGFTALLFVVAFYVFFRFSYGFIRDEAVHRAEALLDNTILRIDGVLDAVETAAGNSAWEVETHLDEPDSPHRRIDVERNLQETGQPHGHVCVQSEEERNEYLSQLPLLEILAQQQYLGQDKEHVHAYRELPHGEAHPGHQRQHVWRRRDRRRTEIGPDGQGCTECDNEQDHHETQVAPDPLRPASDIAHVFQLFD